MADDAENAAPVNQRRSFTREFKLNAVGHYYHHHGKNIQNTAHFNVDRKQVRKWLKNELKLNKQEKGTRAVVSLFIERWRRNYTKSFLNTGKLERSSKVGGLLNAENKSWTKAIRITISSFRTNGSIISRGEIKYHFAGELTECRRHQLSWKG